MGGAKPSVTLTFAGDHEKLTQSMEKIGSASREMGDKVKESGKSYEHLAEKSDLVDTRAMGLADTFAGVRDGLAAWGDESITTGEKIQLLAMAGSDLASGFTNFLIPALANSKVAMMAHAAWSGIVSGATKAWAVAQQMLNLAFWVSPIGLIIIGIVALVAVVVLIATKTDWFQRLWAWAWSGIKSAAMAVWDWLSALPGRLGSAFSGIANVVSAPFRAGFNAISRAWNSTVGRLRWTVPGWVPGLGGMTVAAPLLPTLHRGGVVPGLPGQEVLAVLRAGERVSTGISGGGGGATVTFAGGLDSAFATAFMYLVRSGLIRIEPT